MVFYRPSSFLQTVSSSRLQVDDFILDRFLPRQSFHSPPFKVLTLFVALHPTLFSLSELWISLEKLPEESLGQAELSPLHSCFVNLLDLWTSVYTVQTLYTPTQFDELHDRSTTESELPHSFLATFYAGRLRHAVHSSRTQQALQQDTETKGLNANRPNLQARFRLSDWKNQDEALVCESNSQDRRSNPAVAVRPAPSESCEFGLYTFLNLEAAGNHLNNSNQLRNLVWFCFHQDFDGRKG